MDNTFIYTGTSMNPFLKDGDLLLVSKIDINKIKPGDIVIFKNHEINKLICHRVIKTQNNKLLTKGDNVFTKKLEKINKDQYIGKVIRIKKLNKKTQNLENYFFKKINYFISWLSKLNITPGIIKSNVLGKFINKLYNFKSVRYLLKFIKDKGIEYAVFDCSEYFSIKAIKNNKGVGSLKLEIIKPKKYGFISNFWVRTHFRNRTIGDKLLNISYEIIISNNCNKILLEVEKNNVLALNFYKRRGFYENKNLKREKLIILEKILDNNFIETL